MPRELLWKRAVRRGFESLAAEQRCGGPELSFELTAMGLSNLCRQLARGESVSEAEMNRRLAEYLSERSRHERRIAATWRQVTVEITE